MATVGRQEGSDSFAVELLQAGRCDQMSSEARHRIFGNLGITFAPAAGFHSDAFSQQSHLSQQPHLSQQSHLSQQPHLSPQPLLGGTGSALSSKGVFALASGSLVAALAIWGGTSIFNTSAPTGDQKPPALAPSVLIEPGDASAPLDAALLRGVPAALDSGEPRARPAAETVRKQQVKGGGTLSRQLELVDRARAALQTNNPSRALLLLDKYQSQFPRGSLGAEATVLRVEALVKQGNHAQARRVGDAFLKRAPNSPYSRRLRSLLDRPPRGHR